MRKRLGNEGRHHNGPQGQCVSDGILSEPASTPPQARGDPSGVSPSVPFQLVKSILRRGGVNGTVFPFLISFHPTSWPFSVLSQLCGPVEATGLLDLMRLALSKHLPPALLHKPACSTGAWHLDHIHFLLCVSVYSYIHLILHEECIVSIGTVKAQGCLYSLHHDSRVWPGLASPSRVLCCRRQHGRRLSLQCLHWTDLAAALRLQLQQPLQVLSALPLMSEPSISNFHSIKAKISLLK